MSLKGLLKLANRFEEKLAQKGKEEMKMDVLKGTDPDVELKEWRNSMSAPANTKRLQAVRQTAANKDDNYEPGTVEATIQYFWEQKKAKKKPDGKFVGGYSMSISTTPKSSALESELNKAFGNELRSLLAKVELAPGKAAGKLPMFIGTKDEKPLKL